MRLLTNDPPPDWHAAPKAIKDACREAALFCKVGASSIYPYCYLSCLYFRIGKVNLEGVKFQSPFNVLKEMSKWARCLDIEKNHYTLLSLQEAGVDLARLAVQHGMRLKGVTTHLQGNNNCEILQQNLDSFLTPQTPHEEELRRTIKEKWVWTPSVYMHLQCTKSDRGNTRIHVMYDVLSKRWDDNVLGYWRVPYGVSNRWYRNRPDQHAVMGTTCYEL